MANAQQLQLLKTSVQTWNQWRTAHLLEDVDLTTADLSGTDLGGADLSRADLRSANLTGARLVRGLYPGDLFEKADLHGANLSEANLSDARLTSVNLEEADLSESNLNRADLENANLRRVNLERADLSSANLNYANLQNINLRAAFLGNASLQSADLRDAVLRYANLRNANLRGADLRAAILLESNLTGANLQNVDLRGAVLHDAILLRTDFSGANLQGIDLRGANLEGADLSGANLEGVHLPGANLVHANFQRAILRGADLSGAILMEANLGRANLDRANLSSADLRGANLGRASLGKANLQHAIVMGTNLVGANIRGANLRGVEPANARVALSVINYLPVIFAAIALIVAVITFEIGFPNWSGSDNSFRYEAHAAGLADYSEDDLLPGSMKFEYPVYLLPSSSEVVTLTITPFLDVNTNNPTIFQRIPIPAKEPLLIGEYYDYLSNILLAPEMRATLSSEGIKVTTLSENSKQTTNIESSNLWSWIILAPEQIGTHPLYLSIFLGDNREPVWSFSFTLSVTHPTPIPSATWSSTPKPTSTLPPTSTVTFTPLPTGTPTKTTGQQLQENFVTSAPSMVSTAITTGSAIFAAVMLFLGTILGAFIQSRAPQKREERKLIEEQKQVDDSIRENDEGKTPTAKPVGRPSRTRLKVRTRR